MQLLRAQSEYAPDIAAIDLFQSLVIVTACALDYVLQTEPLHLPGFGLAGLRFFRHVPFGVHKAVRCRSKEVTYILGNEGTQGWTPGSGSAKTPFRVASSMLSRHSSRMGVDDGGASRMLAQEQPTTSSPQPFRYDGAGDPYWELTRARHCSRG